MEMILFIGIQATGKSSFYRERFFHTHVRINGDMLKTARREELLVDACLHGKTPFVIDKMNLTRGERAARIQQAKAAGFSVVGYYFESKIRDALARNQQRPENERVPDKAVLGASGRLELPNRAEGFDRLYYVKMVENQFVVEEWKNEV